MSKQEDDDVSALTFTPTCDLYDTFLDQARIPALDWRSFGAQQQFCGQAYTIQCFDDNSRVKETLEQVNGKGRVLVVHAGGSRHCAMLGDLLAASAVQNEWHGILVNGCVRDADALQSMTLGILALGCTPRKSVRRGQGMIQVPVTVGGVVISPSDLVFADADGVLVLDPAVYRVAQIIK